MTKMDIASNWYVDSFVAPTSGSGATAVAGTSRKRPGTGLPAAGAAAQDNSMDSPPEGHSD